MIQHEHLLTHSNVTEALGACFTSSNPFGRSLNIVELGLIDEIDLVPDFDAPGVGIPGVPPRQILRLKLLPPAAGEDANAILLAQIRNRLLGLPQLSRISVEWVEGSWTQDRLALHLREELQPAFSILNNRKRV